jgi:hypothetical protein
MAFLMLSNFIMPSLSILFLKILFSKIPFNRFPLPGLRCPGGSVGCCLRLSSLSGAGGGGSTLFQRR